MPQLRGTTWYVAVKPRGYPRRIVKSTGQGTRELALAYEATLRKLAAGGRHDLLDAVRDGRLHVSELYSHDVQGRLHDIQLGDRALRSAVDELLDLYRDTNHQSAMNYLLAVAPAHAMSSWLLDARNLRRVVKEIRAAGLAAGTERLYMTLIGKLVRMEFGPSARRDVYSEIDIRAGRARERHLSREEIARIERHAGKWWPLIALSLATGVRKVELQRLKVQDVDFENRQLRVFGKGDKWRKVPVPDEVLGLLRAYMARTGVHDRLFPHASDHRIDWAWHRIRRLAELPDVRWHDFRRTFGVSCARNRLPLSELQQYMGHASVATTVKHYGTYVPDGSRPELASAMAALGFGDRCDTELRAVR